MPRLALALLLTLHGAIHLLGFAKGMALADVEALKQPISRLGGALWLTAAALFLAAAILLYAVPGRWWIPAVPALLLSQGLILGAWSDARFGTLANIVILVPLAVTLLGMSPWSLASEFRREAMKRPSAPAAAPGDVVTEADLAPLPPPVRQYLRRAGAVGRPHVRGFEARFHGRIRNGLGAPWMDFVAEQTPVEGRPGRLRLGRPVHVRRRQDTREAPLVHPGEELRRLRGWPAGPERRGHLEPARPRFHLRRVRPGVARHRPGRRAERAMMTRRVRHDLWPRPARKELTMAVHALPGFEGPWGGAGLEYW